MPKTKAAANGAAGSPALKGHNSGAKLSDDEQEALGVHHQLRIAEAQRKLDVALVEVSNARNVVNGNFKRMTADIGFTRDDFQREVLDKLRMTPGEFKNHLAKIDKLHRIAGLKQGDQIDLLDHVLPDTVDEQEAAFQDGYMAGRRADDPTPPSNVSGIMQPKWMEGWHAGQAYNGMQLAKASEVLARPKPGEMAAAPDGEGEEEDPADPEVIKRKAESLAASGWTDPTAEEQGFEATADELAAQKGRQSLADARDGRTSGEAAAA